MHAETTTAAIREPLFQLIHTDTDGAPLPPPESLGRLLARLRTLPPDEYIITARECDDRGESESWGCSAEVNADGSVGLDLVFFGPDPVPAGAE
jgi:hypothetical protein